MEQLKPVENSSPSRIHPDYKNNIQTGAHFTQKVATEVLEGMSVKLACYHNKMPLIVEIAYKEPEPHYRCYCNPVNINQPADKFNHELAATYSYYFNQARKDIEAHKERYKNLTMVKV